MKMKKIGPKGTLAPPLRCANAWKSNDGCQVVPFVCSLQDARLPRPSFFFENLIFMQSSGKLSFLRWSWCPLLGILVSTKLKETFPFSFHCLETKLREGTVFTGISLFNGGGIR